MGVGEWTPWPRAKKAILALGIAFAILTVSIIAFALVAEGAYTDKRFKPHSPIFIDGDADFGLAEGVTGGSGTEVDPFVIEGWEIFVVGSCAISVNNTDAHLVIRNVSLNANWYSYSGATSPIGISLKNASNVRIESSFISYFQSGVRANGTLGVTEGIEISGCTFTSTGQHVMISNTSDCLVTHSFFSGFYDRVLLISNCTSVMCSFNKISAQYYSYFGTYAVAVKFENVTGSNLEENDISGYGSNLWIVDAYDATIRNNSFRGNDYQYDVVAERCTRVLFSRNEISAGEGILAKGCSNTTIDANYLHPGMYARGSMGLSASSSVGTVISGNTIVRGEGIIVTDSRNSNVYDNYVSGAGITSYSEQVSGMMTYGCYNLTISRNIFVDCTASGLYLSGVNITVEGNEISHNSLRGDPYSYSGAGLTASGSNLSIRNNKISSNTVSWNTTPSTSPGILLRMISNSTFEGNNVSDDVELEYCDNLSVRSNAFAGGWNLSVLSWTDKTVFEHNNFPESIMIDVDGNTAVTFWDAGYPSGGNYWSSYIGEDLMSGPSQDIPGPDGFGDTAYQMSGGEMDYYPRMRPANDQDVLPPVTIAICNGTLGDRMWYISDLNVTLYAFDSNTSSLDTRYSIDSGAWSEYTSQILVTGDGVHILEFRSEDDQGNLEGTKTAEIRIDTQAPSLASDLKKEYWFRTKTADTRYIQADFNDSMSGVSYSSLSYDTRYPGYSYPRITDSSCDWLPLTPETGRLNATIEAVDGAGNSFTYTFKIRASVSPNTTPLSHEGPYGWWLILAVVVDMIVGLATLGVLASSRENGLPGGKWKPRTEGERHYDEDVIDGYGKFRRQV